MNNQPVKVLYETVGKLTGINVVFDPEYQAPPGNSKFTIDLTNTSLEEALDFIAIQTKSYWKPLSSNTIFVTNDNVTKRRDYEDYVVKVFYIKNSTTVQESSGNSDDGALGYRDSPVIRLQRAKCHPRPRYSRSGRACRETDQGHR